ncbi:hypothetical protein ACEWY4_004908 [Coilia grayii]|uniref:Kringle domain-containing protein n=1 Tax=Coilia grayii TaxID=363190 RepID=A0ABD1KMV5_9TELE
MIVRGYIFLSAVFLTTASVIPDCIRVHGGQYDWERTIGSNGEKCLNWLNVTRGYNFTRNNTALWDHSFCRNPDSSVRPWCYVLAGGTVQKQDCDPALCQDQAASPTVKMTVEPPPPSGGGQADADGGGQADADGGGQADADGGGQADADGGGQADADGGGQADADGSRPVQRGSVAVKPDTGISRRVRVGPKQKKDLGALGYALGGIMMLIIIMLGTGIIVGYFYKKAQKLKQQQEQRAYEQEMHRMNLPLSAFSNPACQLDEDACSPPNHQEALLEQEEVQGVVEEEEDGGAAEGVERSKLQEAVVQLGEEEEEEDEEEGGASHSLHRADASGA